MRRAVVLRLLLIAFAPFVVVELGLRLAGYEEPRDPYLTGFDEREPIFRVVDGVVEVRPSQRHAWRTAPFPVHRPAGHLLIASVGDSTAWGHRGNEFDDPLDAYADVLERSLAQSRPDGSVQVINVGARTFASGRVLRVVREVLTYDPDIVVAYVGTSEHLEHMLEKRVVWQESGLAAWLGELRLVAALRAWLDPPAPGLTLAQLRKRDAALRASFVTPDAILAGAEARDALVETATHNLTALADACAARQVPLLLATVPANLRFPPFASRFSNDAERDALEDLFVRAGDLLAAGQPDEALALLTPALGEHPGVAGLLYLAARAHDRLGDTAVAREAYLAARDADACPARALGPLNDAIRDLAAERPGVFLVDAERVFEDAVPDRIPDERLFLDNCHPNETGHRLLARQIRRVLKENGLLTARRRGSPAAPERGSSEEAP